jgi:hypothetical protein
MSYTRADNLYSDQVIETTKLFSLFCTAFATWRHLEAHCFRYFGLLSLYGGIWKLTVFAILDCFDTEQTQITRKQYSKSFQIIPKQCFKIQRECKIAKPVLWSQSLCRTMRVRDVVFDVVGIFLTLALCVSCTGS